MKIITWDSSWWQTSHSVNDQKKGHCNHVKWTIITAHQQKWPIFPPKQMLLGDVQISLLPPKCRLKHFQFLKLPDLFVGFQLFDCPIRLLRSSWLFLFLWVGLEALRPWGLASTPHVPCLGNLAAVCGPSVICHCQSSSSISTSSSSPLGQRHGKA